MVVFLTLTELLKKGSKPQQTRIKIFRGEAVPAPREEKRGAITSKPAGTTPVDLSLEHVPVLNLFLFEKANLLICKNKLEQLFQNVAYQNPPPATRAWTGGKS